METRLEELTKEFYNCDKITMFEEKVLDKRTQEDEYVTFNVGIVGRYLCATHVALNQEEEDSPLIANKSIKIDVDFSLDENLQTLYEVCIEALFNSEFYDLEK